MKRRENPDYATTKIWGSTLRKLQVVKLYTGESVVAIMDRLVKQELKHLLDSVITRGGPRHTDLTALLNEDDAPGRPAREPRQAPAPRADGSGGGE